MGVTPLRKVCNIFCISNKLCQSLCWLDRLKSKNVAPGVQVHLQVRAGPTLMVATDIEMKKKPKLSLWSKQEKELIIWMFYS